MEDDQENIDTLDIRCPECRQRFSVTPDFMERLVECGGCDQQFRIDEDVIVRSKKFYPGERRGQGLQSFQRAPLSGNNMAGGMKPTRYTNSNNPEQLEPTSPQHTIAGIFGVVIMAFTALILLFSGNPGSSFASMTFENKLVLSSFVSLLGFILLVYANPRARWKAGLVGLVLAAGVVCIPFFGDEAVFVPDRDLMAISDTARTNSEQKTEPQDPTQILRERYNTKSLEEEKQRLVEAGSNKKVFGIYLTEVMGRNKYMVRDYLIRETGANYSSYLYPRGDETYLMVLTGVEILQEELVPIANRLGEVEAVHPEISVIVVRVDNNQFISGSVDKLNDSSDIAFYELNRQELKSIDLDRVESAVIRLADAEPKVFRNDITKLLIELLNKPGVTFHGSLSRALLKWAEDPIPAAAAGLITLQQYASSSSPVSEDLVALVTKAKRPEAIPTIVELWVERPVIWDSYLGKFGASTEPFLLEKLSSDQAPLRRSAVKILGEVGTAASIPALREILVGAEPETRVLVERAIQQIEKR